MITTAKRLNYALGYLALDLFDEARAELARIPAAEQSSFAVRAVHLEVLMATSTWPEVVDLARALAAAEPAAERPWICLAYALRELGQIEEARRVLLQAEHLVRQPSPLIDYNLACYYCLLGEPAEARRRLALVLARDASWLDIARDDADLASLQL